MALSLHTAYLLSIHQLPEVDEAAAHVEGADAVLVRHAQPQVVGVVAHVHREGLVPKRVQVVVDDPRLEDAGGAQRPRHEGVRLVLVEQVEEAPACRFRVKSFGYPEWCTYPVDLWPH